MRRFTPRNFTFEEEEEDRVQPVVKENDAASIFDRVESEIDEKMREKMNNISIRGGALSSSFQHETLALMDVCRTEMKEKLSSLEKTETERVQKDPVIARLCIVMRGKLNIPMSKRGTQTPEAFITCLTQEGMIRELFQIEDMASEGKTYTLCHVALLRIGPDRLITGKFLFEHRTAEVSEHLRVTKATECNAAALKKSCVFVTFFLDTLLHNVAIPLEKLI